MSFLNDPIVTLTSAGGVDLQNAPRMSIQAGSNIMAVKLELPAGFLHPRHNHPEHESMGVVVTGHVRMVIDDADPVDLFPGDIWHHPVGVFHSTEAVVASEVVEMHGPLRADLLAHLPTPRLQES
jgi:quercetin dioxygenase-like cupin family protein